MHHLVISDSSFARNSSEAMLGFVKLLATEHEVFVDELHVAPAAQGKKLSYHLLDAIGLLHEAREKQARLQVKRENEYAVRSYKRRQRSRRRVASRATCSIGQSTWRRIPCRDGSC